MVAVVSGSGLGLFNSSTSQFTGGGADGNSNVGRGRDQIYVNSATGNLIVQSVDETLSALGLDFAGIRTYNSQGLFTDDNGDNWRLGVHQRLSGLTGTVNTANSTITKTFGDGAVIVYTYNTTRARYESNDGDGANDFLTYTSGTWTWTDGSSRVQETYDSQLRLATTRDADNNSVTYNYDSSSRLTSVVMAGTPAQTVYFDYTDSGGAANNLRAIRVVGYNNGGTVQQTQTLTRYYYDSSNRLRQVIVDLTPSDNTAPLPDTNGDGLIEPTANQTYITTYSYDGTSKRIASITQSDGSSVSFGYQQINGDYRLTSVTDAENRTTTFTYSQASGGGTPSPTAAPANTTNLSNQDTANLPRIDSALTTNATQNTPYARIDSALSTTDTQNVPYTLNSGLLTTPAGGGAWASPAGLTTDAWGAAQSSKTLGIAFDSNGNGFALTSGVDSSNTASLRLHRYTRSNNTWSSAEVVSSYVSTNGSAPPQFVGQLAVDSAGNAVIAWSHANITGVRARRYTASTGLWGSAATITSTTGAFPLSVAVNGGVGVVAIQQGTTATSYRHTGSSWGTLASLGNVSGPVSTVIDGQGNVSFLISTGTSPTAVDITSARYIASINVWSSPQARESSSTTATHPTLAIDSSGNGFAVWAQGSDVMFSRYTGNSNSWTTAAALDTGSGAVGSVSLAMDAAGNALVGWVQNDGSVNSVFAKRYNASTTTWGSVVPLESSGQAASNVRVAISGGNAAVTWTHNDGTRENVFAATYNGTVWSSAAGVEAISTGSADAPQVAIDGNGNATAIWGWGGGSHVSYSRFTPGSGGGAPYYVVPSGATWQSIANTLYGINSAAAGTALQTMLGNPALTTGAQLTGFQTTLNVPTTVTVPQYLTIPSGATWQSIANTVYGVNSPAAGTALQTMLGNPALTAGNRLTGFQQTLNVTTTLAPHYLVVSGDTWQIIASRLFGSGANNSAGASALQTALGNPSIATGARLYSIPSTLPVTTTLGYYYYTVQSGNTWSGITQSIYGTTDANAIAALQAAVGTTTLPSAGARLNNVPLTLNYTPVSGGSGPTFYQSVTVASANASVTYQNDTLGRLTGILRTTGSTTLETRYTYDTVSGNVQTIIEDPTGLNRVTTFAYDAVTGVLNNTRDNAGNTVARTYNSNNQLLTEVRYSVADPDGAGSGLPSGAMTTRYVYNAQNHLRFVISADGRVTEHQYNGSGLRTVTFNHLAATYTATPFAESDLASWVAGAGAGARERIDYRYDWRGNVDRITQWASTDAAGVGTGTSSVTQFVYDQRGQLLQTIDPRGSGTAANVNTPSATQAYAHTFTYDGFGRVLTNTEWLAPAAGANPIRTRTTTTAYDDAGRRTTTTLANNQITISSFNRAGELTGIDNGSLGATLYSYDAAGRLRIVRDPTLVRQFSFYDDAGRLIGKVDGDGSVTELIYDKASQLIKTVRHSTLLSATRLASLVDGSNNPTAVTFATVLSEAGTADATDQVTRQVYDAAGRLVYTIDEIGAVTKFTYDGANRLVEELKYNNPISIARATDQVLPAAVTALLTTHADDRRTRHFYDNDGNRVAVLDAAGALTEFTYGSNGRLITRFERANPVAPGVRAAGTLAQLQASAGTDTETVTDPEVDITTHYYHDMQGRLVGELDGEGYFTRTFYDVADKPTSTVRYDRQLSYTSRQSQATLEAAVAGAASHTTTREFDGAGRLTREIDFEATATEYEYDNVDNLLSERRAAADPVDERWTVSRFDGLGRVTQELSAEGKVALIALGTNPSSTDVENVWNRFGIAYVYDTGGRLMSATARPNDSQTNVTSYFYDSDGRLRFEVNPLGERKEYRYDAFGRLTEEIRYSNRISTSGLTGGLLTAPLLSTLTASADSTRDSRTTLTYTPGNRLESSTTAEGAVVSQLYNSFGELRSRTVGTGFAATTYEYTARGELKNTYRNGVLFEAREYDVFGRLSRVTDGRGKISRFEYDRLGRQVATIDALGGRNTVGYDGYSRIKSVDDATSGTNNTSYVYDDVYRTMTVDTPEGVRVVTTHNRHGQTTAITIGTAGPTPTVINSKSFSYDKNGNLLTVTEGGVQIEARAYDRGGRQVTVTNARGVITTLTYDQVDRKLTTMVDSPTGGLRLTTTYAYDGLGRLQDVTDPNGTLTRTTYDRDGRITQIAVDPSGLNLRTSYTYDTRNNTLTVTEASGTSLPRRTQYIYDNLGRRIEQIVDPTALGGTLNLRTQYKYDNADNVTREIDTRGNSCWYVYDDKNRLTHKIDALGGVTAITYDAVDRVASTRRYASYLSNADLAGLAGNNSPTTANFTLPAAHAADQLTRSFYDKDGREKYSIDGVGTVTQRTFNAMGDETRVRVISAIQLTGNYADLAAVETALGATITNNLAALDRVTWNAYDLRGRVEFSVDSMDGTVGSVRRFTYDNNGNVIATRAYATSRALNLATDLSTLQTWASSNANATYDQVTRYWYDNADRARFVLDAEGFLTETRYNDSTRATTLLAYKRVQTAVVALGASSTAANVTSAIVTDAEDHVNVSWVDAAGRDRFNLDAEGYLSETRYNDDTGAVIKTAYAEKPGSTLTAANTLTQVNSARVLTAARDRTTMTWTDAAGRKRFALDAENYLVETRYNDTDGSTTKIAYLTAQTAFNASSRLQDFTAATLLTAANDQLNRQDVDLVGRVNKVTDAESKVEFYGFDAIGQKTKFTNKLGTALGDVAYTWDYTYDGNGNLLTETSPNVDVYSATATTTSLTISAPDSRRITTRFEYDFLGNVRTRTEALGILGQERVTSYTYDALGRQTRTTMPQASVYRIAGDTELGNGAPVLANEELLTIYTETVYDALGNAYRSRRVSTADAATSGAGVWSFKTYDRMGRVEYEVDAMNYVTRHQYDAFGNETTVTRYASAITRPSVSSATLRGADLGIAANAPGRTITRTYDRRNLARTLVMQSSDNLFNALPGVPNGTTISGFSGSSTTTNEYNAFGEIDKIKRLIDPATGRTADTWLYYDRRGLKVASISPLNPLNGVSGGDVVNYLTEFGYDALRNVNRQIEYANPIAVGATINKTTFTRPTFSPASAAAIGTAAAARGFDREVTFGYDRMGRMTRRTETNVEFSEYAGNILDARKFENLTTRYGYDALGNQVSVTDAAGRASYTYYDVLGRKMATADVRRNLGDDTYRTPFTRFLFDANGNVLQQIEYLNAFGINTATNTYPTSLVDTTNVRRTSMRYDARGHVVQSEDANGADRFASYNAAGLVAKEWQVVVNPNDPNNSSDDITDTLVTLYHYNALNQLEETIEPVSFIGAGVQKRTLAKYNAFGEMYQRGTVDAANPNGGQEFFDYDSAGNMWRTNTGDGVVKVYLYDLAGNVTLELRAQGIDLKSGALAAGGTPVTLNSAADVIARYNAGVAADGFLRTEMVYDENANVVERRLPVFESDSRFQPAATDVQLGLVSNVTYLSWVPVATGSQFTLVFGYRALGSTGAFTTRAIESLAGGRSGVNVNDLYNAGYEYRLTATITGDPMPYAETTGTFQFNRTTSTTGVFPTVTVDPASQVPMIGNQTGGYIIWTAPSDTSVSARMRFNGGSWITATRPSGFQVDARTALAVAGNYTWDIEYYRGSTLIAAKTGTLTSSGNTTTRALVVSGTGNTTPTPYSGTIPNPVASGQNATRTLSWAIANASVTETGGLTVDVQYRRALSGSAYSGPVQVTWNGSVWAWNVASLDTGVGTDSYEYIVTLRAGNRAIATQSGTFALTDNTTTDTVTASLDYNFPPTAAPTIGTITGTGGGYTVSATIVESQYPTIGGLPFPNEFVFTGHNIIRPIWTGPQTTAYVVVDYISRWGSVTGFSGYEAYSTEQQMPSYGATVTSGSNMSLPEENPNRTFSMGDMGPGGISVITRVRVYASQGGQLLADSNVPNPAGRSISWAAPPMEPSITAKVFWDNGGTWTPLGDAVWSNYTFSISVDSVPTGTRNIKIEYTRPGENWACSTAVASMTQTSGAPVLGPPSNSNHDPSWINTFSGGSDGSLHWTGQVASGGRVQIEEWNFAQQRYDVLQTWYSGSSFAYDFSGRTPSGSSATHFTTRIRYFGPNAWATSWAQVGVATLRTSSTTPGTVSVSVSGNTPIPAAVFVPTVNSSGISWTYSKLNPTTDLVRFRYWTEGEEAELHEEYLPGTTSFSSTFPQMFSQSARIFWMIEYLRAGETNSYARATGDSLVDIYYNTSFASATITGQSHAYPSTVTPIPTPTYRASDRAVIFTTAANSLSDIKFFLDGSTTSLAVSTEGAGTYKVILPSNVADGGHTYNIVYQSGSQNPYARVSGTFTLTTSTTNGTNFALTVAPQRSEGSFSTTPSIVTIPTANPPYANYSQISTPGGPVYIPVPRAYSEGGGWYISTPASPTNPQPVYSRLASGAYTFGDQKQMTWPTLAQGISTTFEYWPLSNPASVSTITVYATIGGSPGVNINSLAAQDYGYRIRYSYSGTGTQIATTQGTFNPSTNVVTVSPSSASPVVARPTLAFSYDRWGNLLANLDAAGNTTSFRYNQHNQQLQVTEAAVKVLDTRTTADETTGAPVSYGFYDKTGNLIALRDANGNDTQYKVNEAGQVIWQIDAGAGEFTPPQSGLPPKIVNVYDAYGQLVQATDQKNYRTRYVYDNIGQQTQVWREIELGGFSSSTPTDLGVSNSAYVVDTRTVYDQAGRRVREVNGMGESIRYYYDLAGNVRATWNAFVPQNQFSMIYTYDVNGFKTSETDAVNTSSTWTYDYFGRIKTHRGMQNLLPTAGYGSTQKLDGTGTNYTYRYNFAGLLDLQTSDYGQNISFQYDQAGQLTTIQDSGVNRRTTFVYDQAGRHVRERVVIDGRVHQDTRTTYDSHNRIATLSDPDYQVSYLYDAAGNRTLIKASYANESGTWVNQELYYTYDAANRVLISQGKKFTSSNGALTWVDVEGRAGYGPQGVKVTYNERGERVTATQQGQRWQYANGIWGQITPATGMYTEHYTYDGLGRLKQVDKETDNYLNSRSELRQYVYDKADRATRQTEYFLGQNSSQQWVKQSRVTDNLYNAAGQIAKQTTSKGGRIETIVRFGTGTDGMGAALLGSINGVPNWSAGYDRAGILRGYDVSVREDSASNGEVYVNQFRNYYTIGESYLLNTQQAVPDRTGQNIPLTGTTFRLYNVNEELSEFRDSSSTAQDKWRKFANNQAGQALTTIQQNFNTNSTDTAWNYAVTHSSGAGTLKVQHFFYADGKVIGSFGQLSPDSPNVFKANFDVNYTPISTDYPATTPATIVAVSGDTPRVIAARIFGDASLWYIIAQENLYGSPDEAIAAGSVVRIPNQVISLSNSGSVFKPFNPSAVLGDTNPTQPPPPPKSMQCRSVARIIGAVVSIIVAVIGTVYSWNPVFSGALGAAAGNRAEQTALLMLNGEYDYFGPIEGVIRGFGFGDFLDGDIGNMLNPFSDEKIRSLKERWTALGRQAVGYGPYRYWGTDKESSDFELLLNGPSELGAKGSYDRQATVIAAAAGAATAYVSQGVSAYDFAGSNILGAGAGAVAGYTTQQVVSSMFGRQTHWSWRDIATSALSAMVSAGVSGYAEDLGAGKFWSDVAGNASSVGVQMLRGGKKTAGEIFVDVFGNAIGNSVARSLRPEPTITERFGDAEIVDSITVDGDWIRASIRQYSADGTSYELVTREYSVDGARRDVEGNTIFVEERVPYGTDGSHDLLTNIMEPLRTGEKGTDPLLLADLLGTGENPPTPAQLAAMRMRVQRDLNQAMYERTGRMPIGNLESYSASVVQVFGGDQSTYASHVNTLIDSYGLSRFGIYTGKFMKGFGDGFIGTFTEPVKMTRDLLAIPVDMIDNSWFGDSMQLNWWSSIGKAEAAGNVGTEGRILNVVGSVPILNIGAASYQGTKSFMAGDYLGMTEQGGSLVGGAVAGLATPGPSRGPRPSRAPGSDPSYTLSPISGDPASPNFVGPLPRREAPVQIDSGRGIFFIDDQILPYIDTPKATLGLPDKPHFFMPLEDSAGVVDVRSAYRETGGAPGTERALKKYWNTPEAHPDAVGDLYAVEFPLAGQSPRVPTRTDSGGFKHYTEGGHTALQLGDGSGFQINRTREFVIPGGQAMPAGSILYKIGPGGVRVPIRTWP